MTPLDRVFLLATGLLAAYQISAGIDHLGTVPIWAYTVAFGVLLVAGLLLLILGLEALDSPLVVIAATLIPLSLSLGLVWQYFPAGRGAYATFALLGLAAIVLTRLRPWPGRLPTVVLALVHGIAGLVIGLLPLTLVLRGQTPPGFALVSLGGALIGIGGLLLAFLKAGRPLVGEARLRQILPALLLLMTLAFVSGFALAA
jgi:hypothetical protein